MAVQWPYEPGVGMTTEVNRRRSERLEVRTTPEDRALIDRAVEVSGTDLTGFIVANLTVAAHRILADRSEFVLDAEVIEERFLLGQMPVIPEHLLVQFGRRPLVEEVVPVGSVKRRFTTFNKWIDYIYKQVKK